MSMNIDKKNNKKKIGWVGYGVAFRGM